MDFSQAGVLIRPRLSPQKDVEVRRGPGYIITKTCLG